MPKTVRSVVTWTKRWVDVGHMRVYKWMKEIEEREVEEDTEAKHPAHNVHLKETRSSRMASRKENNEQLVNQSMERKHDGQNEADDNEEDINALRKLNESKAENGIDENQNADDNLEEGNDDGNDNDAYDEEENKESKLLSDGGDYGDQNGDNAEDGDNQDGDSENDDEDDENGVNDEDEKQEDIENEDYQNEGDNDDEDGSEEVNKDETMQDGDDAGEDLQMPSEEDLSGTNFSSILQNSDMVSEANGDLEDDDGADEDEAAE
eukprot:TRINITY_DN4057_c0_g1_i1.p1 TRINITY_DN4057_c0_g1~~TRINITY_DN4057_c0_g1_i1.p1  ORF type:complete len:264 (-),score=97.82 TRINITY_DN4057_c0_g1_i1:150-941(-)